MNGIIFENIDTGESVRIGRSNEGKNFQAKLSAVMNSSNLGINADRGQDYGWRLAPEQQAILEEWEQDPTVIEKVMTFTKVPMDGLTHADFLAYMVYQQEIGISPENTNADRRREAEARYRKRVQKLRGEVKPEPVPEFDARSIAAPTIDDFTAEGAEPKAKNPASKK